jgi:hypothetical protein
MTSVGVENPRSLHSDRTVRKLDAFPELVQALRDGDLLTARLFCARLFNLDERQDARGNEERRVLPRGTFLNAA